MTRSTQMQKPLQDSNLFQTSVPAAIRKNHTANLASAGDSASDGDATERPVREKLKKTSIATIPKTDVRSADADDSEPTDIVMGSHNLDARVSIEEQAMTSGTYGRGRPARKRSLEDLDPMDSNMAIGDGKAAAERFTGHARKRSRDVRTGEGLKPEGRQQSPEAPLHEMNEDQELDCNIAEPIGRPSKVEVEASTPPSEPENVNQHLQGSTLSPRKKRSRDQFEVESQREQKIAATEETRARRRSSSEGRNGEPSLDISDPSLQKQSNQNGHTVAPKESYGEIQTDTFVTKIQPASSFANTSAVSPFATTTPLKDQSILSRSSSNKNETSSSAFASSGFAAFSGLGTSSFGSFGGPAATSVISPISALSQPYSTSPIAALNSTEPEKLATSTSGGPLRFSNSGSSFASAGKLGFASAGGFASAFNGGSKLSSFAAPTGDTKFGNRKLSTLGAATDSDQDDSGSENTENNAEEEKTELQEDASKYQIHEVETGEDGEETIFQNRGKLYQFQPEKKSWAERGVGPFKLNITRRDRNHETNEDDTAFTTQARFIMRAHATHRVVLNAPIFKEMSIGDPRGKEPAGKQINFSVYIDGKVVPHLLRMSKEDDIKSLYREVRKIQDDM